MFTKPGRRKSNSFCAFCRTPRRIQRKRNISAVNILASLLMAGLVTTALWQRPDPRGIVVFVIWLALAELCVQLRWRLSVVCRACGFNPVLYLKHPDRVADKVRAHIAERRASPEGLLARPLNLPTVSAQRAEDLRKLREAVRARDEAKPGSLVSKSV